MNDNQNAAGSSWIDHWLNVAAEAQDLRIRENAVVALVTLGGRKRMEILAHLVGTAAQEAREGKADRLDVISLALRETRRLSEANRAALSEVLAGAGGVERKSQALARLVLQRRHWLSEWTACRRLAPRVSQWRIVLRSAAAALIGALAVGGLLRVLASVLLGMDLSCRDDYEALTAVLAPAVVALVAAVLAANSVALGLRRRGAVLFDALLMALVASVPGVIALRIFSEDGGFDVSNILYAAILPEGLPNDAWWLYAIIAIPGFALLRVLATAAVGCALSEFLVASLGSPVLWATVVAVVALRSKSIEPAAAASAAWVVFALSAGSVAIALRRREGDWPRDNAFDDGSSSKRAVDRGMLAAIAAVLLLAGAVYVGEGGEPFAEQATAAIPLTEDEIVRPTVRLGQPTRVTAPSKIPVKVALETSRLGADPSYLLVRRAGERWQSKGTLKALTGAPISNAEMPGLLSFAPPDSSFDLCVARSSRQCRGVNGIVDWVRVFAGLPSSPMDDDKTTLVMMSTPKGDGWLPLNDQSLLGVSDSSARQSVKLAVSQLGIELTTTKSLNLSIEVNEQSRLQRAEDADVVLVLQRVDAPTKDGEPTTRTSLTGKLMDPPRIRADIPAGRYLICLRLFNHLHLECDGLQHEILSDVSIDLELTRTKAPTSSQVSPQKGKER